MEYDVLIGPVCDKHHWTLVVRIYMQQSIEPWVVQMGVFDVKVNNHPLDMT